MDDPRQIRLRQAICKFNLHGTARNAPARRSPSVR